MVNVTKLRIIAFKYELSNLKHRKRTAHVRKKKNERKPKILWCRKKRRKERKTIYWDLGNIHKSPRLTHECLLDVLLLLDSCSMG